MAHFRLLIISGILAAAMAAPSSSATAQESSRPAAASQVDCSRSDHDTHGRTVCAERRRGEAAARLTLVFRRALVTIDAETERTTPQRNDWKRAMRESQRHWLAWVKTDCGPLVRWEMYGGSGAGAASAACEADRTEARIKDLQSRYWVQ